MIILLLAAASCCCCPVLLCLKFRFLVGPESSSSSQADVSLKEKPSSIVYVPVFV